MPSRIIIPRGDSRSGWAVVAMWLRSTVYSKQWSKPRVLRDVRSFNECSLEDCLGDTQHALS